jgi:hypothetical protein
VNKKDISMLITEDFLLVVRNLSDNDGSFDSTMHIGRAMVLMEALLSASLHAKKSEGSSLTLNDIKDYLELANFIKLTNDESVVKDGYDVPIIKFLSDVPSVDNDVIRTGNFSEVAKGNYNHYKDYLLNLLNKI